MKSKNYLTGKKLLNYQKLLFKLLNKLFQVLHSRAGSWPYLHTNSRLGWKGLPETNTLDYYENL
jgi:hypothetical protein